MADLLSLSEAVQRFVNDGDTVALEASPISSRRLPGTS